MIITLKLLTPIIMLPYQLQYSAIFRFSYERTSEGLNQKDIRALVKERWSNPKSDNEDSVNSWIAQCAIVDAQSQHAAHQSQFKSGQRKNIRVIWGGKGNLRKRSQGKLSSSEWHQLRLRPMELQGEAAHKSNRLFDFSRLSDNILIYKPNKHIRIEIPFHVNSNQRKQIQYLINNIGLIPIQVQLKRGQICLSFEQEKSSTINKLSCRISYRILGIDQNPNYIGISIIDFKDGKEHLVTSKVYSWSKNSRVDDNKRDHETKEISHDIIRLAKHYRVSEIGIEDLKMGSRDAKKGRNFNRLVNNQWNRELFQWTISKLSDQSGIEVSKVNCAYSSTIGNLLHADLPDPCAAAWEIARRAHCKYKKSLCMFPPLKLEQIKPLNQWKKDGFDLTNITSWVDLHNSIKNAKLKYRVQLSSVTSAVSRFSSTKSGILLYFIPACL
jgi:IS605 OrfB family transposase